MPESLFAFLICIVQEAGINFCEVGGLWLVDFWIEMEAEVAGIATALNVVDHFPGPVNKLFHVRPLAALQLRPKQVPLVRHLERPDRRLEVYKSSIQWLPLRNLLKIQKVLLIRIRYLVPHDLHVTKFVLQRKREVRERAPVAVLRVRLPVLVAVGARLHDEDQFAGAGGAGYLGGGGFGVGSGGSCGWCLLVGDCILTLDFFRRHIGKNL